MVLSWFRNMQGLVKTPYITTQMVNHSVSLSCKQQARRVIFNLPQRFRCLQHNGFFIHRMLLENLLLNTISMSSLHKKHRDEVPKPTGSFSFLDVQIDVGKVHVILESCIIFWSTIICSRVLFHIHRATLHHSFIQRPYQCDIMIITPAFTTETGDWD